ncbi:MAG TPA: hypothetical protein VGR55_02480 [Candidatus Acidoferrum sp.]|nr:hypothetical protein [Candidatus Acidoferrum sp.]
MNCLTNGLTNCLTKTRLLTAALATAALWAAACSPGHPIITPPPPAGKFTNASLNGTYAFMTSGEVIVNTVNGPTTASMVRVGSFVADGSGHITGGVEDVNASGTVSNAATITGGSYTVNSDGRGILTLSVVSSVFNSSINFSIVLTSGSSGPPSIASGGLMIDETTTGQVSTGSGNFIQQNTTLFATTNVNGTYVFDFSGLDSAGAPASIVGRFPTTSGSITTGGIEDGNDNGQLTPTGTVLPGSFTSDPQNANTLSSSGRGLVAINGETFAFYIVDATRVRLISIGTSGGATPDMLTGDAVLQASVPPAPSGSFAFLVAGSDLAASNGLIRVARFDTCAPCAGPGPAVSKILLDVNDAAHENEYTTFTSSTPSINYDTTSGRGVVSFSASTLLKYSFVFYLSSSTSGVIQDVSPSDSSTTVSQVADGSIAAQTSAPFSGSNITGPYAMNWSGLETSGGSFANTDEEDLLALQTVTNLNLTGTYDLFQFTGPSLGTDLGSTGSINFNGGDGTGGDGKSPTMNVNLSGASPIHMVVYFVNPQLAFFANRDNTGAQRIVAGILQAQQ